MPTESAIRAILHDLWYQHPSGATTIGPCGTPDCTSAARGSRQCPRCIIKQARETLGEDLHHKLADYNSLICQIRRLENDIISQTTAPK